MQFAPVLIAAIHLGLAAAPAHALDDAGLAKLVGQRLQGDRTGACMAVAVVERDRVARTYQCADDKASGRIDADSAFEIGSVSKTMTAALLADLLARGQGSLDDPFAAWLPPGTPMPVFQGQPILLRHVVTHTSGLPALPSRLVVATVTDPYAGLDEEGLLASLADVQLTQAPGVEFEYSNFASMLLSYAVARRAGDDFEQVLKQRLFAPLGMRGAYIKQPPAGIRALVGHSGNGLEAPAWHFAPNLGGVGGVRATLQDMVCYVQGGLGMIDAPITPSLLRTHLQVSDDPPMGMNWIRTQVKERTVMSHEGGTGGFSSFVSIDPERQRGVVILSDTSWSAIGGLGSLGMHLLDPEFALGSPRRERTPSAELLQGLVGDYQLQGAINVTVRQREGRLYVQAEGEQEYTMGHDDSGDFYALQVDALLRPRHRFDGSYGFTWMQMGAVLPATRIDDGRAAGPALSVAELKKYEGRYSLPSSLALQVREEGGILYALVSEQGEFALRATAADVFEESGHDLEIRFSRDAAGVVEALELYQDGQLLQGRRQ